MLSPYIKEYGRTVSDEKAKVSEVERMIRHPASNRVRYEYIGAFGLARCHGDGNDHTQRGNLRQF